MWEAEDIVDERGNGNSKEYFIKWVGWSAEDNSWEKKKDVSQALIDAWHAQQAAAAETAARFSDEERIWARRHAAAWIGRVRLTMLQRLQAARRESARSTLVTVPACDARLFNAIYVLGEQHALDRTGRVFTPGETR